MKGKQQPPRFTEGADVPAGVREALDAAIDDGPSDAALSRMDRALAPVFSAPPAPVGTGSTAAAAAKGAGWTIGKATTLVAFACAAGGYGAWRWSKGSVQPPRSDVTAPSYAPGVAAATPSSPAEEPEQPAELPAAAERPRERNRLPAAARPTAAAPSVAPAAAASEPSELALVRTARQSLAMDPARSLALVGEARRRFPSGSLSEEVEFIEIEALKQLGRNDEARVLEERFRARHPSSMHGRTVRVPPSATP